MKAKVKRKRVSATLYNTRADEARLWALQTYAKFQCNRWAKRQQQHAHSPTWLSNACVGEVCTRSELLGLFHSELQLRWSQLCVRVLTMQRQFHPIDCDYVVVTRQNLATKISK